MSLRGVNWVSLRSRRGCLSVLAAALVFLNPVTCFSERLDQKAKECCASRRCHTMPSRNRPDCCKVQLLSGGQSFLAVAKTTPPQPTVSLHPQSDLVFSAVTVANPSRGPVPTPRDHSPPELYTLFCSFLI